jgi:hypothetical protein
LGRGVADDGTGAGDQQRVAAGVEDERDPAAVRRRVCGDSLIVELDRQTVRAAGHVIVHHAE